jgi:cell division transport system permease protein
LLNTIFSIEKRVIQKDSKRPQTRELAAKSCSGIKQGNDAILYNLAHSKRSMKNKVEKASRRRLKGSFATLTISITLVLWMIGMLGMVLVHGQRLSDLVRENVGFTIMLSPEMPEAEIRQLQKSLDTSPFVKSTEYISKEEAAREMEDMLQEEFIDFLGYTLPPSLEVRLNAAYANNDSLSIISDNLSEKTGVLEVVYQKDLVQRLNENIRKISYFMIAFSALLFVIAIVLVNNTIRLSVFSRRFIIRSMQLVGATQGFIRKPFLIQGLGYGILSSFLAIGLIILSMNFFLRRIPEFQQLMKIDMYLLVFAAVLVFGILFSLISTGLAVRKYLKLKPDELYYF